MQNGDVDEDVLEPPFPWLKVHRSDDNKIFMVFDESFDPAGLKERARAEYDSDRQSDKYKFPSTPQE